MSHPAELTPAQLRWRCTADDLDFETTADVTPMEGVVGQDVAVAALRFGLEIDAPGQHVFIRGLVGTGRLTLVKQHLSDLDTTRSVASDRLYVHNFEAPDRPRLITMPRGRGRAFVDAMTPVVDFIAADLPTLLTGEALAEPRKSVDAEVEAGLNELSAPLEQRLAEAGLALAFQHQEEGLPRPVVLPRIDGEPAPPERIQQAIQEGSITAAELAALQEKANSFAEDVSLYGAHAAALAARHREKLDELVRSVAKDGLRRIVDPIAKRFPEAAEHLDLLVDDVVSRRLRELGEPLFIRLYDVNLFSSCDADEPRPVIVENAPSIQSLLGSIDQVVLPDGTAHAPHMGLYAGALVRADGGTLIMDARDLASTPGAWQALTRTLRSGEVQLSPSEGMPTTLRTPGLKPDPIPVDVKVVLMGEHGVYYALDSADPDFPHLFKVLVDFEDMLPRTAEGLAMYAGVLARIVREEQLLPLTAHAVAALIEHGARVAAQPDALTARFGRVADIAREAVWLARAKGRDQVCGAEVEEAIRRTKERAGMPGRLYRDRVQRGILRIETDGTAVGQINGLATTQAGQLTYGFPSRITATVGPGSAGAINIEGEAELSGSIHTKAFHIIGGALRTMLRTTHPLSFDASIAFEQSYGGIDGDSASGAEVCALISAIADVPLRQGVAMTGAIDQLGNILPVGAVNEKIEGFFDTCALMGLTGDQGCILPASNIGDLMLRQDVVDAVAAARFHVWPVEHVRDALAVLVGAPVGPRDSRGDYPRSSVLDKAMDATRRLWEQSHGAR